MSEMSFTILLLTGLLGFQLTAASPLNVRGAPPTTQPFNNPSLCQGGAWANPDFVGETGEHGELNGSNPFCETRWPSGDIITSKSKPGEKDL